MISKTIKYEDYNGNEKEKTYYFHMNEAAIVNWLTTEGDYTVDKVYERMVEKRNGKEIIEAIEDLIKRSYGEKSIDGETFDQSEEVYNRFRQSPAYSVLFMELVTDAEKAADFFNGIMPKKVLEQLIKSVNENPEEYPEEVRKYYMKDNSSKNDLKVLK